MREKKRDNGILIVEDNDLNRAILVEILSQDYKTIQAGNGEEAFQLLKQHKNQIDCIVLDLYMPVMDGFEFLKVMYGVDEYKNIPVIVSTGSEKKETEKQALRLGAWDFVSKPYDAEIIKFRIRNAIDRSQLAAFKKLEYMAEYDSLTGIYKKEKFFSSTHKMLEEYPDEKFVLIRFDINHFQLVNSFYGNKEGDQLLRYIAGQIKKFISEQEKGTFGRMEADVFAFCFPYEGQTAIKKILERSKEELRQYNLHFDLVPACGVYVIDDNSEQIDSMLDKASLAAKKIKGNYIRNFAFYTNEMKMALEQEQIIVNEMSAALEEEQFFIYLQPKYSLITNKPTGAEALVRWKHPERGMIMPGLFIPIFEKNGFIAKLDYYVWERVCRLFRGWLDEGIEPFPVSVNVSRANLYNPQIVETICDLAAKYQIPPHLLQLELTESAYTDNPQTMRQVVKRLRSKGFSIHMDDFGNGYSSLSILKDIEVDVLKIDMRFFENTEVDGRGENIIAAVIRMAKWLNIPAVAEGVEREAQVEFLKSIGCEYVQGFYYAKPMPINDFEALMRKNIAEQENTKETFNTNEFWSADSEVEALFADGTQATCIYEFDNGGIEVLRVNNAFYEMFGSRDVVIHGRVLDVILPEYHTRVVETFRNCINTKGTGECEYRRTAAHERVVWVNLKLRYINQIGNKQLLIGTLFDITTQKGIESELQKYKNTESENYEQTNRMLVIDDSKLSRKFICNLFENSFEILEAENGKEALEVLEKEKVDIILLDVMMPVMDGIAFLEHKRNNPALCNIPIIIMTADNTPKQQMKTLSMGADDYIVKPFIREIVLRRVKNVLDSRARMGAVLKEYKNAVEQAKTDPLTQIYNRAAGERMIASTLAVQTGRMHALIMLDLDDFKNINDKYGHDYGDQVLQRLASELNGYFRKEDIVSRLGGDEFCVFLANIPSEEFVLNRCMDLCNHINEIEVGNARVHFSCSIGIAVTGADVFTFEALYKNADHALYRSKRMGKNTASLFGHDEAVPLIEMGISKRRMIEELELAFMVAQDATYEVMYMSKAAVQLCDAGRYQGKKCYEVLYGSEKPCEFCNKRKFSYEGFRYCRTSEYLKKGLSIKAKMIDLQGHKMLLFLLTDLSDIETKAEEQ